MLLNLVVLTMSLTFAAPAAPTAGEVKGYAHPCDESVAKYCKDLNVADGSAAKCMDQNADKLPPECHTAMAFGRQRRAAAGAACIAETQKHCGQIKGSFSAMNECLKVNNSKFSKACREKDQTVLGKTVKALTKDKEPVKAPVIPKSIPNDPAKIKPPPAPASPPLPEGMKLDEKTGKPVPVHAAPSAKKPAAKPAAGPSSATDTAPAAKPAGSGH